MSSFIVAIFYEGRLPFFQNKFNCFWLNQCRPTNVSKQVLIISIYFTTCPGGGGAGYVVVVAQDMWWWLRRICGGGSGYVVGEIKNKANSAQLELELGLSLAKVKKV